MLRLKSFLLLLIVIAAAPIAPADAQTPCMLCAPDAKGGGAASAYSMPLEIEISSVLDFDRVTPTAAPGGSVLIDPVARTRVVRGALSSLGGLVMTGSVTVRGEPGRWVRVALPDAVTLTSANGTAARVSRLVTDLPPSPRLGSDGTLRFAFGGVLDVSGDMDGDYRGRIPITVDYQ